jgi:hypothetical protein
MSYPAPHHISASDTTFFGNGLYKKTAYGPADGSDISSLPEQEKRDIVEGRILALAEIGGWSEERSHDTSLPVWQQRGFDWEWRKDGVDVYQRVPGEFNSGPDACITYYILIVGRSSYSSDSPHRDLVYGEPLPVSCFIVRLYSSFPLRHWVLDTSTPKTARPSILRTPGSMKKAKRSSICRRWSVKTSIIALPLTNIRTVRWPPGRRAYPRRGSGYRAQLATGAVCRHRLGNW